ncbi:hypothetical protein [Prosthecomicrobium hirschii]|uniref:hypothetical protein n=1 Tax=Prosthecodimorpha hirschii TaxID=665126 RepID=UPI002220CEC1|nr:hypothetical protein [Prosthecomicrobium hirschii]MCW1840416.1 hypothetical protein [Prosthecomicrobium hirschii]
MVRLQHSHVRILSMAAVAVLGLGTGPAMAVDGSRWGARDPVTQCAAIGASTALDSNAVTALVRCEREQATASDELWLVEDFSVQIGAARPHKGREELMTMADSDTSKSVHSLRGAWTWVVCRDPKAVAYSGGDPARNCGQARVAKAEGACWVTSFGTWRCNMTGPAAAREVGYPPPR